jgi:hypothetical protein
MADLASLDLAGDTFHAHDDVMDEPLLCVGSKQPEQITRLAEIVISPVFTPRRCGHRFSFMTTVGPTN